MKILVENSGYELLNLGDTAMLQVAVSRLQSLWPNAQIQVITASPERLSRYCPGTIPLSPAGRLFWLLERNLLGPLHKISPSKSAMLRFESFLRRNWPNTARRIISKRLRNRGDDPIEMNQFVDAVLSSDLVVCTGGGYLTDPFEIHAIRAMETLALAQFANIPTAFLGQGIGPITSKRLYQSIQPVLKRAHLVTLREGLLSADLARQMGVHTDRLRVTGDEALELIVGNAPAQIGQSIGLNIRNAWYAGVQSAQSSAVLAAVQSAAAYLGAQRILPLPVSFHDGGEDLRAVGSMGVAIQENLPAPENLLKQVAACRVVVTGSYHAAVFALGQGIPVVALASSPYYFAKFEGLADLFPQGVQIVSLKNPETIQSAICSAWETPKTLKESLQNHAIQQVTTSREAYQYLQTLLRRTIVTDPIPPAPKVGAAV